MAKVLNIHERALSAALDEAGALINRLASEDDILWPHERWPAMKFDRPLSVGAKGGHGPVRYEVAAYEPGRSVQFRFKGPKGFLGHHTFDLREEGDGVVLRHTIDMNTGGPARVSWPLLFRPLHDALLEDALDKAERHTGANPTPQPWSLWVRFLRWLIRQLM